MSRHLSRRLARMLAMIAAAAALQVNSAAAALNLPQTSKLFLTSSGTDDEQFGSSVAIDGNTAVVGAPYLDVGLNDDQGGVTVYVRGTDGAWTRQALLLAGDGAANDHFGLNVAFRGDTLLVGAPGAAGPASPRQGAVYVFTRTNDVWAQTGRLTSGADANADDLFGYGVGIDGDTAVVSAPGYFSSTGAAWTFTRSGGSWTISPRLMASDHDTFELFGVSVAISGDTVIAGAAYAGNGTARGAAYVFTRRGGTWPQQAKLTSSPGDAFEQFGTAVDIQQDTALIGAPCPSSGCRGAAYIFTRVGTTWTQRTIVRPDDSVTGDAFGWSVSLAVPFALVSAAFGPPGNLAGPGEVHLFNGSGSFWSEQTLMRASDGATQDWFGTDVAINRRVGLELTAIAGAPRNNVMHGGAYIFANMPPTLTLVAAQTTPENVTLRVPFTIADGETPVDNLGLQAFATDIAPAVGLIPDANLTFEGTGTHRTLVIVPAAALSGQATVGLSVSDDYFTVTTFFRVTVTPVDAPPTITAIADQTTAMDTPTAAIPFTIADVDTPIASLIVSATSSNSALVPPANIVFGGGAATRTVTITPASHAHGTTTISVLVDDGTTRTTRTFTLTVPDPSRTYYLAEGSTGAFFDTDLLLANPNDAPAPITITFFRGYGGSITQDRTLPALSRTTMLVDDIPGMEATTFSTAVTSSTGLPLVVERTMRWDASGYGAHGEKASDGVSSQWYFAEGSQGYFSTFFLLVNPHATANAAHVTYFREGETPLQRDYALPPASRVTIDAGTDPELVNRSFGALVRFDQPGAAERAMYFGRDPLWTGGHDSAGVEAPSTSWFLAEGATGSFFDTFVLLANPGADDAIATLTYFPANGTPVTRQRTVPAGRRITINLAEEDASLASAAISTRVESTQPIVVERSQYWPATGWYEGHNSFGVTAPGMHWGLAEGRVGGPAGYQTYILLANPGSIAADVTVRFLRASGAPLVKTFSVPPATRFNIAVTGDPHDDAPELIDEAFGAAIESTQPIVVERAMYSNANGVIWAAGTGATATRLP